MARPRAAILGAGLAVLTLALLPACARSGTSAGDQAAAPTARTSAAALDSKAMQAATHADAALIVADIERAMAGDPSLAASSNPYDYTSAVSDLPAFRRLVSRGPGALGAIAQEILARPDGLDAYALAIVGETIQSDAGLSMGPKTWQTGWGWANQYRSWASEHSAGT